MGLLDELRNLDDKVIDFVQDTASDISKALNDTSAITNEMKLKVANLFVGSYLANMQSVFDSKGVEVSDQDMANVADKSCAMFAANFGEAVQSMPKNDVIMKVVKSLSIANLPMFFIANMTTLTDRFKGGSKKTIETNVSDALYNEAALIAEHVYGDSRVDLIGGWTVSDAKIEGVKLEDQTGLLSRIYERNVNGQSEYIYATAGTDFKSMNDWAANVGQVLGSSDQYKNAYKNAKLISDAVGNSKLTFVGHSLGGGEAAYNALKIPTRRAITFNPAGVSVLSDVKDFKGTAYKNIDAFITLNDPLNIIQDILDFIPSSDGLRHYLKPSTKDSNGHSITTIIHSIQSLLA